MNTPKKIRFVSMVVWILVFTGIVQIRTARAEFRAQYTSSHALVVGVDKYLLWPHLEYAVTDAREMAQILRQNGFEVRLLLDEQATGKKILNALDYLAGLSNPDGRLLFYFSGHGQTEDLASGGERGYLVPVDADQYNWRATMMPMAKINQRMKSAPAKHVFMVFDACYSGLGLARSIQRHKPESPGHIQKMMRLRSVQVLTAGGRSEQVFEVDGHGLFTDHLMAALSGAADLNNDGFITATEVYATVRPSVTKRSFGRQTPQFGYIAGEGDMVFKRQTPPPVTCVLNLKSETSGVDVWIQSQEAGRRLGAGRHALKGPAGRNQILVKKGGRTLFKGFVVMGPDQHPEIRITDPAPPRQPGFSMSNITHPAVKNYANTYLRDVNGDGMEEFITRAGPRILALNQDGSVLWETRLDISAPITMVDQGDYGPVIGLSARQDDRIHLILLDNEGRMIWRNQRRITKTYQGKPDGGGRLVKMADLDGDGKKEILAITSAGYAWKPRGIIAYDMSGRELWRYLTGPFITNVEVWEHPGGLPDIVVGTYSPGNGNRESFNNTNDHNAYVISISANGRTNWVQRLGTHFTGTRVLLADLDKDGRDELYASKYTAYDYRKDEGGVYRFNRRGRITARYEQTDSIKSLTASGSPKAPPFLWASDKSGGIMMLDNDLQRISRRSMNKESIPLIIHLAGVRDYDGDGNPDLLTYSFNRLQQGKNPRTDYGPKNKVFFSNMQFQILSADLKTIIKEVSIAEEWDKWRGFKVMEANRPDMSRYPFVSLSDKITAFNF